MPMDTVRLLMTIWFEGLWSDLRSAVRSLQHSRRYTGWVVGSLAIGMAVTIAALALLNAVMFSPFPGITDQPALVRVNAIGACSAGMPAPRSRQRHQELR